MVPFHPLASDADADPGEVAEAQARCALALGRLEGLLAGLSGPEKALFCWTLLRSIVNGQRTLHPTPHANSPDRQNSLHRRYFLTPFNIRAAALDDGASLRP